MTIAKLKFKGTLFTELTNSQWQIIEIHGAKDELLYTFQLILLEASFKLYLKKNLQFFFLASSVFL